MRRELLKDTDAERGFTLVEVIAALVVASLLAAVATIGIGTATRGYVFAKRSIATAQVGQAAMTRLSKEISVLSDVSASSASSLSFSSYRQGVKGNHTLSLAGSNLLLDQDPVAEQVSAFSLAWFQAYGDTSSQSTWDSNQRLVRITLTLTGPDGIPVTFAKMVRPRNLGN